MKCMPDYAEIGPDAVKVVKQTEKDLDVVLIAYERSPTYSDLSEGDLQRIQDLEQDLDISLVAFD